MFPPFLLRLEALEQVSILAMGLDERKKGGKTEGELDTGELTCVPVLHITLHICSLHNQRLLLAFHFLTSAMVNFRSNYGMIWNASTHYRINSFREKECIVQKFFRLLFPFNLSVVGY